MLLPTDAGSAQKSLTRPSAEYLSVVAIESGRLLKRGRLYSQKGDWRYATSSGARTAAQSGILRPVLFELAKPHLKRAQFLFRLCDIEVLRRLVYLGLYPMMYFLNSRLNAFYLAR
jgi:hypothetical protein